MINLQNLIDNLQKVKDSGVDEIRVNGSIDLLDDIVGDTDCNLQISKNDDGENVMDIWGDSESVTGRY